MLFTFATQLLPLWFCCFSVKPRHKRVRQSPSRYEQDAPLLGRSLYGIVLASPAAALNAAHILGTPAPTRNAMCSLVERSLDHGWKTAPAGYPTLLPTAAMLCREDLSRLPPPLQCGQARDAVSSEPVLRLARRITGSGFSLGRQPLASSPSAGTTPAVAQV